MPRVKIDNLLQEIRFGKVTVIIQDGKIVSVPEQEVEWPGKVDGVIFKVKISKAIEIDQ